MLSYEEVEEVLPSPIKIEICCDSDYFKMTVQDSFEVLLDEHNKKYDTKIENISRRFSDFDESQLEDNEFEIRIGGQLIHKGKGPDFFEDDQSCIKNFYKSIVSLTEGILDTWHDQIISVQEENNKKLEIYKEESYDEILYAYYCIHSDTRAFQYLKKLAARYPNSFYKNKLRRVYINGLHGWHKKNKDLANKMNGRVRHRNF